MRLRITFDDSGNTPLLKVDGELVSEGIAELEKAVRAASGPVELDLADLRVVDADGVAAVRRLVANGARVIAASPFLQQKLAL
jgi:ABC-type transporter Mla MlaB component